MKIKSFNIYDFGILAKQSIDELPSGLAIFLGQNEAGKSTSLEFFRTVLTGFPASRSKRAKEGVFANKSDNLGGFLELETQNSDIIKVERTRSSYNVFNATGAQIPNIAYEALLAGTNREIYSSLYGFSLNELQIIDTLESQEVQNVLYGTSFGLGLYSPQKAINYIDSIMNAKHANLNNSYKNFFKQACQRIEEINQVMKERIAQNQAIDAYYDEFNAKNEELEQIQAEDAKMHKELQDLEIKIRAWEQYKEYYLVSKELDRLPPIPANFPENGLEKLKKLQDALFENTKSEQAILQKKERMLSLVTAKEDGTELLFILPQLQELLEYKASYINALNQLPNIANTIRRSEEELQRHLDFLGKNWTMQRTEEIDASLFLHEKIEEYYQNITKLEQNLQQSTAKIDKLNQDKKINESELNNLNNTAQGTQEANNIDIDPTKRTILATMLRRVQDAQVKMPEKQRLYANAKSEYEYSIRQLNFSTAPSEQTINNLNDSQEFSLKLAKSVCEQSLKAKLAEDDYLLEKRRLERLEEHHNNLTKEHDKHLHLERRTLLRKKNNLKRMQYLQYTMEHDEENIKELDEHYEQILAQIPLAKMNKVMLGVGAFSLILGSILLANYFLFNNTEADISFLTQNGFLNFFFPSLQEGSGIYYFHSPVAYLFFALGFTLIYQNIPQTNPYRRKKLLDLEQAGNRVQVAVQKLKNNQLELNQLCAEFKIAELNDEELEIIEEDLEKEQEQLLEKEKIRKETFTTEDELIEVKEHLTKVLRYFQDENEKAQSLRRKWQEHFEVHSLATIPAPEVAEVFFTRINNVRLAKQNVSNIELELKDVEITKQRLYLVAEECIPEIKEFTNDLENACLKIQHFLDLCDENDRQNERRQYLQESIANSIAKADVIIRALEDEEQKKKEYEKDLNLLQEKWKKYLIEQKLNDNLSPQTAKTALTQIEKCRNLNIQLEALKEEQKMFENQRDKLAIPVQELFDKLAKKPLLALDRQIDYLASLDSLYSEATKAKEVLHAKNTLEEQLAIFDDELATSNSDKNHINTSIENLLNEAKIASEIEFEDIARHIETKDTLLKRRQVVEDTLQFIAHNKNLDEFMKEFEGLELPVLEYQKTQLEEKLQELQFDKEECTNIIANQKAKIQSLESSNALTELKEEKARLEEQNDKALEEYLANALARELLQKAKKKYEKENQPELIKLASEIFAEITDGQWLNISSSIEDNTLYMQPKKGLALTADKLSQGTREQLYLSLRLAHIKNSSNYKESLPLIVDDILVNFDTIRSTQTAKALSSFVEGQKQQILFFTCHPHIANILQENVKNTKLYTIENGTISASK